MSKPIPEGYHAITPSFTFKSSQKAIDFYKKAFGAKVLDLFPSLTGQGIMHATIQIGNSILMMGDEMPDSKCSKSAETTGSSPISLYFYVTDADAAFNQAVAAGGTVVMPVTDMFWGDIPEMNFDLKNPPDWTPPPPDDGDKPYTPKGSGGSGVEEPKRTRNLVRLGVLNGSPAWARTTDKRVNSALLYQLSYRGITLFSSAAAN